MPSAERAIENLIARYAFLVDDGDFAGLGELLDAAEFSLGAAVAHGKAGIEHLAAAVLQTYADGTPRTRHVTTNLIIEVNTDAGTAASRSYFTVLQQTEGFPLQPVACGRYRDRFELHEATWRFTAREVSIDLVGDTSHHVKARCMTGAARPLVSGFPVSATASEVLRGVDLSGKRAIVTGAGSGIGWETARALAAAGAEVTLAVRSRDAGAAAAERIARVHPCAHVGVGILDLADLSGVGAFARSWDGPLDILVNNAGVMAVPALRRTVDGFELQLGTNHLGHFELARLLRPHLAAAGEARVVVVASIGHRRADIDLDDLNFEHRAYDPWVAYGQSKTANILFAVEAARRWASYGIAANALYPGGINTGLDRYQGRSYHERLEAQFGGADRVPWKTVEQGAATSALLAGSPLVGEITGAYFEDLNEAPATEQPLSGMGSHGGGVAPYTMDLEHAARLWEASASLVAEH